jgi:capsid portal protein
MMGIIPSNTGGFGDVEKAAQVFVRNELTPLQERMKEVNYWIGDSIMKFLDYTLK